MILITVGSQKFQFNRLLKAVDNLIEAGAIRDEVFAQTGYCSYEPKHFRGKQFFDTEEFDAMLDKADVMITHGGTGVIIKAVKRGKAVIAVPRKKLYGEHVDDHQEQIIKVFTDAGLIIGCRDCDDIESALERARTMEVKPYVSGTNRFIESIENDIENDS